MCGNYAHICQLFFERIQFFVDYLTGFCGSINYDLPGGGDGAWQGRETVRIVRVKLMIVIRRFDSNAKLLTKYLAIRIQREQECEREREGGRKILKKEIKAKLQLKAIKKAICE